MSYAAPQRPQRRYRIFRSVMALILREMVTRYGRSPGGYVWAFLEPVAGIAILSAVFALIQRSPSLGTNFPLFFATGFLVFNIYNSVSQLISSSIRYSRALLAYPAVTFMDALIARFLLNTATQLIVTATLLSGIIWLYDLQLILNWQVIFSAVCMAISVAIGVGTINCYFMTRFPVWQQVWGIATRPLFILSGIIFIPEVVPSQYLDYLMLNPVIHATSEMRKGFYATYDAVHVVPLYPYIFGLTLSIFGLLLLIRHHKDIVLK